FIEASQYRDSKYIHGAFPEYGFQRTDGKTTPPGYRYEAPRLELAHDLLPDRMQSRGQLLESLDRQRRDLDRSATAQELDRHRQMAVSMLLDGRVHRALDVHSADAAIQDRYG